MTHPAPFGLSLGMKLEEFDSSTLVEVAPFKFRTDAPPKTHPAFQFYVLQITPEHGLSWVKAIGKDIPTNGFGSSVLSAFKEMEAKLKNAYGPSEGTDILLQDSIWNEPRDWMQGLITGERILYSLWEAKTGAKLTEALESIFLGANGASTDSGFIAIEYTLKNNNLAMGEISAIQDDVL